MKPNRIPAPMNVRFSERMKTRLRALAGRYGLSASDVVREAVKVKLAEWERSGVIVVVAQDNGPTEA